MLTASLVLSRLPEEPVEGVDCSNVTEVLMSWLTVLLVAVLVDVDDESDEVDADDVDVEEEDDDDEETDEEDEDIDDEEVLGAGLAPPKGLPEIGP